MRLIICGLSITSSWGNGHAVTYRALAKALTRRGHHVLFLERDTPWYRSFRDDLSGQKLGAIGLYQNLTELRRQYASAVRQADCVILGSFVPEGVQVARWILSKQVSGARIFYDLDTPVTLRKLEAGDEEYISAQLLPKFDYYFSFAGGAVLDKLAKRYRVQNPIPFWCTVDPEIHYPCRKELTWELGYLGTYSPDRQSKLELLLNGIAREMTEKAFIVAGPMYPDSIDWSRNVARVEHIAPQDHRRFYGGQRFTLNLTRGAMTINGYSPSTRLFEAAACGTTIISDAWEGLSDFFEPEKEILVARDSRDLRQILQDLPETERLTIGRRARKRVLEAHTADHRVQKLEHLISTRRAVRETTSELTGANHHE
jgi:spore maturation protein CgeB